MLSKQFTDSTNIIKQLRQQLFYVPRKKSDNKNFASKYKCSILQKIKCDQNPLYQTGRLQYSIFIPHYHHHHPPTPQKKRKEKESGAMVVSFSHTTTTTLPIKEERKKWKCSNSKSGLLDLTCKNVSYQHLKQESSVHFICLVEN